jgi:hypothetical protein
MLQESCRLLQVVQRPAPPNAGLIILPAVQVSVPVDPGTQAHCVSSAHFCWHTPFFPPVAPTHVRPGPQGKQAFVGRGFCMSPSHWSPAPAGFAQRRMSLVQAMSVQYVPAAQ